MVFMSLTFGLLLGGRVKLTFCRTNCDSWGVPWDVRHCHGNRIEEILPIKVRVDKEKDRRGEDQKQAPGWEYSMKIKRTSISTEKQEGGNR